MTKPYRRPASADPPARDLKRPNSGSSGEAPALDSVERFKKMLKMLDRLDELGRQLADTLGVPAEAVIGRKRPDPLRRQLELACQPRLTPEQRAAREAAIRAFRRLSRNSATLH